MSKHILFGIIIILIGILSCNKDNKIFKPTPYTIEVPAFFPTELNITPDNPLTLEGITLGRFLFYDGRLSGRTEPDSLMSCSSCHLQSNAFECGISHSKYTDGHPYGITGIFTPHVMLPLFNLVWNPNGYFWNGFIGTENPNPAKRTLEDVVWMGITAPHEMNGDTGKTVALIQSIPGYPELFKKAFGSEKVTMKNISRAITQFIRTIISSNTKFDRYLRGKEQLAENELNGFVLFTSENGGDCFHCHGGEGNPLFTTNLFYNNGKDTAFTGAHEDLRDRYHVTGNLMDIGAYRAPTLRNIELTAPYMHDGRFKTLDDVINFYSENVVWSPYISTLMHHVGTSGIRLTLKEKSDLKAFIHTLQDDDLLSNPAYSQPAVFPDGSYK
ncbi:MAG: hypothetical protein M0R21_08510 [Lentimicrobiaceae bacterium]|nr:hypothetical protein [Lentimicrobiaceae bacterium]